MDRIPPACNRWSRAKDISSMSNHSTQKNRLSWPPPFQHRFVENISLQFADLGIELAGITVKAGAHAGTAGSVEFEGVVPILTRIKSLFAANGGHALHQFSASEQTVSNPSESQSQDPQVVSATLSNGTVTQIMERADSSLPNISFVEPNMMKIVDVEDKEQGIPLYTYKNARSSAPRNATGRTQPWTWRAVWAEEHSTE